MASILVCYATGEGQTAKVADHIANRLTANGRETTTVNVKEISTEKAILVDFECISDLWPRWLAFGIAHCSGRIGN